MSDCLSLNRDQKSHMREHWDNTHRDEMGEIGNIDKITEKR